MERLKLTDLKKMEPDTIFARGLLIDSPRDVNLANTGEAVRWVAVRGFIEDWAIYAQNPHSIRSEEPEVIAFGLNGVWEWEKIAVIGDKIHDEDHIKRLVPCTKGALDMYRH